MELYLEGLGFRSISKILNVSNVSVLNWIKSFGATEGRRSQTIEELRKNDEISVKLLWLKWMKCTHLLVQKNVKWVWIAVDRARKKFINFVVAADRSKQKKSSITK